MQEKFTKTKREFGDVRLTSKFESFKELKEYCEKRYSEIKKNTEWSKRKKLELNTVIELHKKYLFGIENSLKELKEWLKFRKNIKISRNCIKEYFHSLDLPTYPSKKQRKGKQDKKVSDDSEIPENCIIIDDTHKTLFPVKNKYRGIIDKNEKTIVDLRDNKSNTVKRIEIDISDKKRQLKAIIQKILNETDKSVAIDGELANKNDEVFGNKRVYRYNCKYLGSKNMNGNIPLNKFYRKGESQHLGIKESVYNFKELLKFSNETKDDIEENFKEKFEKIYQKKLSSITEVFRWLKELN